MKFFLKFNDSNNTLIIYPPKQKGHALFTINLDKFKKQDLDLFFNNFGSICEIRVTDAIGLYIYLKRRNLSFYDLFTK